MLILFSIIILAGAAILQLVV